MNITLLNEFLAGMGIEPCGERTLAKFDKLLGLLIEGNKMMNLTAASDSETIIRRHFADSLSYFLAGDKSESIIDIGCGGGYPGLPIKIYADGLGIPVRMTFLDATAKKIAFVKECAEQLELLHCETIAGRAEEVLIGRRESYDAAVSRAVADMRILSEIVLPYVKVGGSFYVWKTKKASEELKKAEKTVTLMGGRYGKSITYGEENEFILQKVKKIAPTPQRFPRKYSQILKSSPV